MGFEFDEAERQFSRMVEKYKARSSQWFEAVESELAVDGRELTRQILQGHIRSRGSGDVGPVLVLADGTRLTHRRPLRRTLQTVFGKVNIERVGYSSLGQDTVFPLDAVLNLPSSSFSAGLQRLVARLVSTMSFTEAISLIKESTGVTIGKAQALQIAMNCVADFEGFYASREKKDGNRNHLDQIVVLTTDGKGIVMRPDGLREDTRQKAEKATPAMKKRLAPGEKRNRKRMAQVASVYEVDRFVRKPGDVIDDLARRNASARRPRPCNKRVWASVEKDADVVIEAMFEEAQSRDPRHKRDWVIVVDGNKHQLRLVQCLARKLGKSVTIILDIIHVIEYLWEVARVFVPENDHAACEQWVEGYLRRILHGEAGKVAGSIRMSAAKRDLSKAQNKIVRDSTRYISGHKGFMQYCSYLAEGYPIASGVIEGACRHLIKDRMDVTGARWSLEGAESVLKLRSLVSSGDFDEYWKFHRNQEYKRNYEGLIPDVERVTSPS